MSGTAGEPAAAFRTSYEVEVAVIGAGQAGLAIGYFLSRQGRRFVILDCADVDRVCLARALGVADAVHARRYSALPGLPFPGDPDGYPARDEVIAYLEHYAETFDLPIELNSEVKRLELGDDGRFRLELPERTITADQVVVATGPFQSPYVPTFADEVRHDVIQTHAIGYRQPDEVPQGTVLVVGGGNTGFQIAKELSATHKVVLSVGSRQKPLPQRLLGRDLFWWLTKASALGRRSSRVSGRKLRHPRHADRLEPARARAPRRRAETALVDADGRTVRFEDGSELEVDAVIWATGYRPTTRGSSCRSSTRTGAYATAAASPMFPASTSSVSPGSTRAARR